MTGAGEEKRRKRRRGGEGEEQQRRQETRLPSADKMLVSAFSIYGQYAAAARSAFLSERGGKQREEEVVEAAAGL
ncbi:hypothetical protein TRIUR3_09310 [Triticum urartu]|uniref:Uncharacterized protein n=1 Tax=Triticum urartu TaxID=4572 RepID=M7YKG2_TRIUA|nr:hypothetical protein TRIUR3_09310 [Triticum urartu]